MTSSSSALLHIRHAQILLLLLGSDSSLPPKRDFLEAAKRVGKYTAAQEGVEDNDRIKEIIERVKSDAIEASHAFKIQLSAIVDCAYTLINATYALEGDGVTVFFAWELWKMSKKTISSSATNPFTEPQQGLLLRHSSVWRDHFDQVRDLFLPAWRYMLDQEEKHMRMLEFLRHVNNLCPWNARKLDASSLKYFVELRFLSENDKVKIEQNELLRYYAGAEIWNIAVRPSAAEYLMRASPKVLLPEARVWRFWYVHQRILPELAMLVKKLAAAQAHSAAAERTGSLFTHDESAQHSQTSVQTASIRMRAHYGNVVDPMQNMPLDDLEILKPQ